MFILIHLLLIAAYQEVLSSPAPSIEASIQERASEAWPYEMCNQPINASASQGRNEGKNDFFIL